MVQIMGAGPGSSSRDYPVENDDFFISDNKNSFSTSTVVVNNRKDSSDILRK